MQVVERYRNKTPSGEIITEFDAGKRTILLIGSFEHREAFDDLLYSIACRKISERLAQKRDNIVLSGGNGTIYVGK